MLVDKGKGMPIKETMQLCEKRTILRELQGRFPFAETHLDLSLLKLQPDAEEEIENIFYDMAISLKDSEMCGKQRFVPVDCIRSRTDSKRSQKT